MLHKNLLLPFASLLLIVLGFSQNILASVGSEPTTLHARITPTAGNTLYVKKGASGTGSSWSDALGELSAALTAARENGAITAIWVAKGTYLPSELWNGQANNQNADNPRTATFKIHDGVQVYGGFNGDETDFSLRNPTANETILSGKLIPADTTQGAYHVVMMIDVSNQTVLDGFTIQHGHANGLGIPDDTGAGVYLRDAHPKLSNLMIRNNYTSAEGAGMYLFRANPVCNQIQILNNTARYAGGAIRLGSANPVFTNLKVINNKVTSSQSAGAAIYSSDSNPIFINALFTKNTSAYGNFYSSYNKNSPTFINTTVVDNGSSAISLNFSKGIIRFYNSVLFGTSYLGDSTTIQSKHSYLDNRTDASHGNIVGTYTPDNLFISTDPNAPDYFRPKLNGILSNTGTPDLQVITDSAGVVIPMPTTDLKGNTRIFDGRIDIGSYENQQIAPAMPGTIYVKKGSNGSGSSWQDAYGELADALKFAQEYKQHWGAASPLKIYVSKGIYKPMYSPRDGANFANETVDNTFLMVKDVQLFGGFDPDQGITDLSHRRIFDVAHGTLLNGDFNGDDVITGMGVQLNITNFYDNAYHTVLSVGDVGTALMDGFTITGGIGRDQYKFIYVYGAIVEKMNAGGMMNINSTPGLRNLIFRGNWGYHGGGLLLGDTPVVSNLTFIQNIAVHGAGLFGGNNVTIRNALFVGNRANSGGGIAFNNNLTLTKPIVENATFVRNYALTSGGALHNMKNVNATLNNSIIVGNNTAIGNDNASTTLVQNSLVQGSADTSHGNLDATGITADQVFIDFAGGNYGISHGSPVIDKGSNPLYTGNLVSDRDIAGSRRLSGTAIEMGAFEYGLPPVITNVNGDVFNYTVGDPAVLMEQNSDAAVSDPDSPDFDGGQLIVHLVNGQTNQDILGVRHVGTDAGQIGISGMDVSFAGIVFGQLTGGSNGTDLIITLNAQATPEPVAALIRNLTYQNTSSNPVTTQRIVELTLKDGDGGYSLPNTLKGNILQVSHVLTLTNSTGVSNYHTNATPVLVDAQLTLSGPAQGTASSATVQISTGFQSTDQLSFISSGGITGSYNGGILTLSGTADLGTWQSLLQSVRFGSSTTVPDLAQRTLTFMINGNTVSASGTKTVHVNYIPVIAANAQKILFVDKNVSGGYRTGSDWANAIPELGDALKWAQQNKESNLWNAANPLKIYVAKGTYHPMYNAADNNFGVDDGRGNTFLLVKDVKVYGGFDPLNGITDLTHNRIFNEQHGSILSGDFANNDMITGAGQTLTFTNNNENAYNVVSSAGEMGVGGLDGFTVKGGNANLINTSKMVNQRYMYSYNGGGIQITYGSPTCSNLNVMGCFSNSSGGGVWLGSSDAKLNNFNIHHNISDNEGGGISLLYSQNKPGLNKVIIRNNKGSVGGGLYMSSNTPLIIDAVISDNYASNDAGGIVNKYNGKPVFVNSIVANNGSGSNLYGSGIHNTESPSTITLINSLILGNQGGGNAIKNEGGSININNSIVLGNQFGLSSGPFDIQYSIVQGKAADPTNFNPDGNVSPTDIFTNFAAGDFSLKNSSGLRTQSALAVNPAINAGNNAFFNATTYGTLDAAGQMRIRDVIIDLGAFEVQQGDSSPLPLNLISFKGAVETNNVSLYWQTTDEKNTSAFKIERSFDARHFKMIGHVESGTFGNHKYSFLDTTNPLSAISYYRLKMIDLDGSYTYSRIVSFKAIFTNTLAAYPNPLSITQVLTLETTTPGEATLFDLTGRAVKRFDLKAGKNTVNLPKLTPGIYLIRTDGGQFLKLVVL
jgi:hypothetical protein